MDSRNSVQELSCKGGGKKTEADSDDERQKEEKLFSAIRKGKLQKVKDILEGVKTNIVNKNNKNNTPLHYAVEREKTDIVRELLHEKWGTDINANNATGDTALHIAASMGNKELAEFLIRKQAKTDVKNNKGQIALDMANDLETIQIFQKHQISQLKKEYFVKVQVPADGSCLFWAATLAYLLPVRYHNDFFHERFKKLFGEVSSVELLLQTQQLFKSYNPYILNTDIFNNKTLKCFVTEKFRSRIIKEMSLRQSRFEDGVTISDILYTKNESYVTRGALQKLFCCQFSDEIGKNDIDTEVLKPNTFDKTAVCAVENVLGKVLDQSKLKQFRFAAYMECMRDSKAWGGSQEILAMTQMLHCNIHVFSNGTQHSFPCVNSYDNIQLFNTGGSHYTFGVIRAQVLIESMIDKSQDSKTYCTFGIDDVSYSNSDGWTPLHLAAKAGDTDITELLLAQGSSTNVRNSSGQTPLDVAKDFEEDCVIGLLHQHSQVGAHSESMHQSFVQKPSNQREGNLNGRKDKVNSEMLSTFNQKLDSEVTDKERSSLGELQRGVDNSLVSDGQSSVTNNEYFGKQLYDKGGSAGIKGGIYQVKLLMLFLYRALEKQYSFRLATEMELAEKFDDLVFEYVSGNQKVYRFLQAKHKEDEFKQIGTDDLLAVDGDFSLLKYFNSYRKIVQKAEYQDGIVKDFIICTNINFKFGDSKKLNLKCSLEKIEDRDGILDVKCENKVPVCYKFKKTFPGEEKVFQVLREASDLNRLARRLAHCVLHNKPILHYQDESIFKCYHVPLAKEVIDVKNKTFQNNFLYACSETLCESLVIFRGAFEKAMRQEVEQYMLLKQAEKVKNPWFNPDCDQNVLGQIREKEIKLQLPKGFGEGTGLKKDLPDDEVTDNEIKSFLEHLVFAVNQPNEVELGEIIKTELGEQFNNTDKRNVYSRFLEKILDWMKQKKGRFLSREAGKFFFDEVKQEILGTVWFNVKSPVTLFTGREKELEELHNAVQRSHTATVISQITSISGLGGIGKTELARKYVHDHCDDYDGNVIWINAEKHETLVESFHALGGDSRLSVPISFKGGKEKKIECIVKEIYMFFARRKCIFVFDNAERNAELNAFLPLQFLKSTDNKPYILITSREKEWESGVEVIELKELNLEDSVNFVKKALNIKNMDKFQEIKALVVKLQSFPLALQQAVAYIKDQQVMGKFDISDYLKEYDKKTKELLSSEVFKGIDNDYAKTTFTTWKITVDKIGRTEKYGQLALEILNAVAYVAPYNIDRDMFFNLVNSNVEEEKVRSAVRLLVKYSMLNSDQEQSVLDVHRLVQEVMRLELRSQEMEQDNLRVVLCLINSDVEKYLDHAVCAWEYASKYSNLVKQFSPLSSLIAFELQRSVRFEEAYSFAQKAAKLLEVVLGADYPCTLRIKHNLAEILDCQGHFDEAFEIFQDVLARSKRIFGPDHHETLSTMHDLAVVLFEKGKYDESLKLYLVVLEKEKLKMRRNELEVLLTMQGLANVYSKLGKHNEALEIYEKTLSKEMQILGPDDPRTLTARNNRASLLCCLRRYSEALEEFNEVLDKRNQILGAHHLDTLHTKHDIGRVHLEKEKYAEALIIFREVHGKIEEVVGTDHPYILPPLESIAETLVKLHNFDEGMKAYKEVLDKKVKVLGADHPDTLSTMTELKHLISKETEKLLASYKEVSNTQKVN